MNRAPPGERDEQVVIGLDNRSIDCHFGAGAMGMVYVGLSMTARLVSRARKIGDAK